MNAWRRALPALWKTWPVQSRYYAHKTYALCWDVKMLTHVSFEEVWAKMCTSGYFEYINEAEAITRIPNIRKVKEAWHERNEDMYEAALETMHADYNGDTDTMQFMTPERELKWGIKVPEKGLDCKYQFVGRSGGWLALTSFMGVSVDADLIQFNNGSQQMTLANNERLPYLYAMIEEITWSVDHRQDELIYQLAFNMRYSMQDVVPE